MAHASSHDPLAAGHADAHSAGHHYVAPLSLLYKVFGALVVLTILTVATGKADWIPSALHVPIALFIALVKVILVAMFFMGLKHDNRVNTVILALTTIFVLVFLGFTVLEVTQRGDLGNVDRMTAADRAYLVQQDSMRYAQTTALPTDTAAATADTSAAAGTPASAVADSSAAPDSAAGTP